jgi:hypothetical protein
MTSHPSQAPTRFSDSGNQPILLPNGCGCCEQIKQVTGRSTTHVAELIAQAR